MLPQILFMTDFAGQGVLLFGKIIGHPQKLQQTHNLTNSDPTAYK
jgi:hypothetical protein